MAMTGEAQWLGSLHASRFTHSDAGCGSTRQDSLPEILGSGWLVTMTFGAYNVNAHNRLVDCF